MYSGGALKATVTGTSATVTGLVPSTSYSFSVVAVDNAGNVSANSATASATTLSLPDTTAPSTPTGVGATAQSTTSIGVSWTASTDASGIKEYRVYSGGALKATVTGTSATVTGLVPSTSYSFSVVAVDNAGNVSANSATASRDDALSRHDASLDPLRRLGGQARKQLGPLLVGRVYG